MKHDYEMGRCIATIYDVKARIEGCSDYERGLRRALPVCLYNNDPTFREIMIKLEAMKHRNTSWWG